ncbi:MAG: hypothetical protein HN356_04880 [Calditrichaeota bacterium]|nr:hypothetical protein [Calditrichota bacterium]MBT7789901.1 hypothetical protein [Calditrichota bacterium]
MLLNMRYESGATENLKLIQNIINILFRQLSFVMTMAVFLSSFTSLHAVDNVNDTTSSATPDSVVFQWISTRDTVALADWLEEGGDPDIYNADYTILGQEKYKRQTPSGIPIPFGRADLSRKSVHGINALHLAVMNDDTTTIGLLLDAGADIEAIDNDNNTPLLASWMIQQDFLSKYPNPFSNTFGYLPRTESQVKWSRKNAFLFLYNRGADISKLTASPEEILTRGTWFNMPEIMKIGLERGADVNVGIKNELCFDDKGEKQGEDDVLGRQLIHLAVKFKAIRALEVLIKNEAQLNTPDSKGQTPFIMAVNSKAMELIEILLAEGISPNSTDAKGVPALQVALQNGSPGLVKFLLSKGVSTDEFDLTDGRPLFSAIRHNKPSMVEGLLECGFDPNSFNENLKTLLHLAVSDRNELMCNILIKAGAIVDLHDGEGYPPLYYALGRTFQIPYSTIQLLLENGSDVNQTWGNGEGPLFAAALRNDPELLRMIIDYGADLDRVDGDGKTSVSYLLTSSIRFKTLKILMEYGANFLSLNRNGWTILHGIIRDKNRELLESVLAENVSQIINCLHKKKSPLHMAVTEGDTVFARLLLQAGADPNVGLEADELPFGQEFCFSIALANNDTTIMRLLFDFGARVYLGDKFIYDRDDAELVEDVLRRRKSQGEILFKEQRAIYLAVAYNAEKCAQVLINEGVDFKAKNIHNQSPLWWAINYPGRESLHLNDKSEVVELLLENGANPDQKDHYGLNLLCHTCDSQAEWLVKLLLKAGANANSKQQKKPALHFAVEKQNLSITKVLIEYGADIKITDRKGRTVFQIAQKNEDLEMVMLLKNAMANQE